MYILSSNVPDNEEPALTDEIVNHITSLGGQLLNVEKLGKRKLAYPIKRTRNGFYVLINFLLEPQKVNDVDHKVRVTAGIIRHLLLNKEESLIRQAKDREEQKMIRRRHPDFADGKKDAAKPEMHIDLDKQIEKALEGDLTK